MPDLPSDCSISIICPVRNEAAHIEALLRRLRALRDADRLLYEIIVSDGGSTDETVALARAAGAAVLTSSRGRGPQLNAGASAARGNTLWFLHADAHPHLLSLRALERASREGYAGGNFRLKFAARGWWPRAFELIARLQRRVGVAYGDSGFWVTRATWEQLGGFAAWPLFEDYDLWRRLNRSHPLHRSRLPLCVSARRIEREPWRVLWLWLRLQWAFWCGVSPHDLARRYHP